MKTKNRILGPRPRAPSGSPWRSFPGCASKGAKTDKVTQELLTEPKEVLFEKGKALLAKKKYEQARKYLNHVFETYPNEHDGPGSPPPGGGLVLQPEDRRPATPRRATGTGTT